MKETVTVDLGRSNPRQASIILVGSRDDMELLSTLINLALSTENGSTLKVSERYRGKELMKHLQRGMKAQDALDD